MGRKKKEETGAHVTPATEAGDIEVVDMHKVESAEEYNERMKQIAEAQNNGIQTDVNAFAEGKLHAGYETDGYEIVKFIGMDQLRESLSNPRKVYEEKALNDLADSIKIKGIVQNLVVRPLKETLADYEIVAGSRRYRAAKIAGLKAVPCVVRNYSDAEVLEIQVIENNQREDVHPLEEGEGYAALLKVEGYTVEAIAGKIGRSDKYVRERLQLAQLCDKGKDLYQKDILKYTHCRILSRLTKEQQEEAIKEIVREDYLTSGKHSLAVKSLEYWVESHIEKKLGSASFPLDDKTLNKDMGACIGCIKNTASDGQLFPEYTAKASKGVCLKPECFNIKVRAYAERLVKEKANDEKYKDVLLVSETSWKNNEKKIGKAEKLVIGYENWERVKQGEKGAQKAIIVGTRDIEDKGKTVWVKLRNKKDAKPSKADKRQSRSQYAEPELTPEQKAEKERVEKHKETQNWYLAKKYLELGLLKQGKKIDKSILKKALIQAIQEAVPYHWNGMVAGLTIEEWNKCPWDKRRNVLDEVLEKKSVEELTVMLVVAYAFEPDDMKKSCVSIGIDLKTCIDAGIKAADEKYPDPAKALIVNFAGLKYGLKESDYKAELEWISDKIRGLNEREKGKSGLEGKDYKELNIINPGGNNVFFRKDAKTGLYRFSTWIDSDGTAMGFDKLPEAKFIKLIKGFKLQAAGKKKSKGKSKKAKKK